MLNVAKIINQSETGKFSNVVFFDKDEKAVNDTYINIPGSLGFPSDFATLVLADGPDEDELLDEPLSPDTSEPDEAPVRRHKRLLDQRNRFIAQFPFDVINLDLEAFLMKAKEEFPGKILRALIKLLEWQKKPFKDGKTLDEFVLMYTARIGPLELTQDYLKLLNDAIAHNIEKHPELQAILKKRTGYDEPLALRENDFDEFFRIAVPKLLGSYIRGEDWMIDPDPGITVFEFDRFNARGSYKMLHFVMHVKRQVPPKIHRLPHTEGTGVEHAYAQVAHRVFHDREKFVSPQTIDATSLKANLECIFARRRKISLGQSPD